MAFRYVYCVDEKNLCRKEGIEFTWEAGMSKKQRQKSLVNLHEAFQARFPGKKVNDISRYSLTEDGMTLSAFHLTITDSKGVTLPVECAYQGGKIMKEYGLLSDLYEKTPMEAKKDPRVKNGNLFGFFYDGEEWKLYPETAFYNYMYITALLQNPDKAACLMEYDAFTDIMFNPEKGTSCQAEACAIYVSLKKNGMLEEAMKNKESFLKIVYHYKETGSSDMLKKYGKGNVTPVSEETPETQAEVKAVEEEKIPEATGPAPELGMEVTHPKYGKGILKEMDEKRVLIAFESGKEAKFPLKWLLEQMK